MLLDQTLTALAGLGFFLAGLHMLSEVVRVLATRQVRGALARLSRVPFSGLLAGSLLGAVTQSTSAAAYVCIGLLNSRAVTFPAALSISSWSGVGTSLLVFLASVDLRLAALFALSLVAIFYLASLQRHDTGRRTTELLLAVGVTLLGLAMVKDSGHTLEQNAWVREFFVFSSESWVYGFLIGVVVTLVMQSSSTVSILVVAMSTTGLLPLRDAIVLVCGANLGSGLSVALVSAHLTGLPRQLALWQAIVKGLGSAAVLIPALAVFTAGLATRHLVPGLSVPSIIAIAYLLLNVAGGVLANLFMKPLMRVLARLAPEDRDRQQFEPAFIIDEAAEDPETAMVLARQEQARLVSLLPQALGPLRPEEDETALNLPNGQRRILSRSLAAHIDSFVREAVSRHPQNADVTGLLLVQRCNDHVVSLVDALHEYVDELSALADPSPHERGIAQSMTESLHFLLGLLAEQDEGGDGDTEILRQLTRDRSEVMTRFRSEIVAGDTPSNQNRGALFVATGLFERMVWLVQRISADLEGIRSEADLRTA